MRVNGSRDGVSVRGTDKRANIAGTLAEIAERSPAGFAIAVQIRFTSSRFLFQTYPLEWAEDYSRRGLVMHDPVVRWCFENTGAVRWRDLVALDTEGVMKEARAHGMHYGISMAHVEDGMRSIAGCARPDRDYLDAEIAELQTLFVQLHRDTAGLTDLTPEDEAALKRMSIRLTRG